MRAPSAMPYVAPAYRPTAPRKPGGSQKPGLAPRRRANPRRKPTSPWRPAKAPPKRTPQRGPARPVKPFGRRGVVGVNLVPATANNGFKLGRSAARLAGRLNPFLGAGLLAWELYQAYQGSSGYPELVHPIPDGWTYNAAISCGPGGAIPLRVNGSVCGFHYFNLDGKEYTGGNTFTLWEKAAGVPDHSVYGWPYVRPRAVYQRRIGSGTPDPTIRVRQPRKAQGRRNVPKPRWDYDPMASAPPIGQPLPMAPPRPVPFPMIGRRRPNPYRDAKEQPRAGYNPENEASRSPAPQTFPEAARKLPGRRTKESPKLVLSPAARSWLGKVVSGITEGADFVDALYGALPPELQNFRADKTLQDKIRAIYNGADRLNMRRALFLLLVNQMEDYAFGKLGQIGGKANRARGATAGAQQGRDAPRVNPPRDAENLYDWEKYVDPDYYYNAAAEVVDHLSQVGYGSDGRLRAGRGDLKNWGGTGDPRYLLRKWK